MFRTELQEIKKLGEEGEFEEEKSVVVREMSELFNNRIGSDKILQVENKDIYVHKEILVYNRRCDQI